MPRIDLRDAFGTSYRIDTRTETTLIAWFDEVLPHLVLNGRPGTTGPEVTWPKINVWPLLPWDWQPGISGQPTGYDWLSDSRAMGGLHDFPARNGTEAIKALADLRARLEAELKAWDARPAPQDLL